MSDTSASFPPVDPTPIVDPTPPVDPTPIVDPTPPVDVPVVEAPVTVVAPVDTTTPPVDVPVVEAPVTVVAPDPIVATDPIPDPVPPAAVDPAPVDQVPEAPVIDVPAGVDPVTIVPTVDPAVPDTSIPAGAPTITSDTASGDTSVVLDKPAEGDTQTIEKTFVLGGGNPRHGGMVFDLTSYDHGANIAQVVGELLQRGLRPVGDVAFVGDEVNADGYSLNLTYSVTVEANVAPEAVTVPPVPFLVNNDGTQITADQL